MYIGKNETMFQEADPNGDIGTAAKTQVSEAHRHTSEANITCPREAGELLKRMSAEEFRQSLGVGRDQAALRAESSPRRDAWLTGGKDPHDPYVLNWSGPLDSRSDWVGLSYFDGWRDYVFKSATTPGWQWAEKGSSYHTGYSPDDISQRGGTDPSAVYFIWDAAQRDYRAVSEGGLRG